MTKLDYSPRTLDDKIIKDGSCAVATLSDNPSSRDLYFVVGGIATQSYLPTKCRRATSDIDLAILANLSYAGFKSFAEPIFEYLRDNKYEVNTRKAQRTFCIDFADNERNASVIEFARHSEKTYRGKEKILQRERAHAKSKIIEGTTSTYIVASPEDIVIPKLVRSVSSLKRNKFFETHINGIKKLSEEEITKSLKEIEDLRLEAIINPGDVRNAEILRFVSDLYDIRVLSELAGINMRYAREAVHDWISLRAPCFERDLIAGSVFPQGLFLENSEW